MFHAIHCKTNTLTRVLTEDLILAALRTIVARANPNTDINGDDIVDIYDAILVVLHYNQHYS